MLLASAAAVASPAVAQNSGPSSVANAPSTADDIAALREQIQIMQAQLDKLQAAQSAQPVPPTAAPPAQAQAKADVPGWAKDTTIGGKAFFNVSSINHKSDGLDQSDNGVQTDVKRFYLTVEHRFDKVFSANLTTDFRYNTNGTSKDVLVYVKKAYVQAKLAPEFFVRVGSADLPWVPFVEDIYGYRYIENTLIDRTKYGTSADWGVHAGGTFGDGIVSYAVSAINGAGYKTLSRSSNTVDLEARISSKPMKNIVLGVGGYTGKLGKSAANLPNTEHRATRLNAVAAYVDSRVRAGVEYFTAKNWNNVTTVATDKTSGWSAFGSFAFTPKIAVFGRYDWVNPNQETNGPLNENYFNVGVSLQPVKNIDLALVYKRDSAKNGVISTSNGNIGGSIDGTYDEFGVFSQVKF
ncbi:MAG: porin [Sphingomicrobium sp.]